ncbi:unnamed protein product [Xylocopa violacea]|uniref:4-nitrophenylphosphatase n=1 Tax=Xylocopa violacea TaxID=135666 RepID=A0ABP1NFF0_XYLVO
MIGGSNSEAQSGTGKQAAAPDIVDLAEMSPEQIQKFLDSFDIVMSDCDGVLWYVDKLIPGSLKAVGTLSKMGKKLYLVTNNSAVKRETYLERMRPSGLHMKLDQIINTARVISWYLKMIQFSDEAFVIGSPVFRQALIDDGIKLAPTEIKLEKEDLFSIVHALNDNASVKAVIADFSIKYDYLKIAYALSCLSREDVLYICGAQDDWIAYAADQKILGSGPMIDIITRLSGKKPINCAKPSETLGKFVLKACDVHDPKRCLFIGDSLQTDIKFGKLCGFQTLLVGSGVNKIEDAEQSQENRPDFYISSLRLLNPTLDSLYSPTVDKEDSN